MTDYTELKKLAESAPEGPWFGPEYAPNTGYVFDNCLGSLLHYESIEYEQEACLLYVAAANPAAVLKLINEIHKLREELILAKQSPLYSTRRNAGRYRWLRDNHIGDDPASINLDRGVKAGLDSAIDAAMGEDL